MYTISFSPNKFQPEICDQVWRVCFLCSFHTGITYIEYEMQHSCSQLLCMEGDGFFISYYYKIMSKCFFFFSLMILKIMIKTIYAIQNWSCMFMNEWLGIIGRLLYMIITIFCERAIPFVSFYRSLDFYWDQSCRKFLLFSQRVTHFHTLNKNYCMFHLRMILNWQLPIAVYKKNHFNW